MSPTTESRGTPRAAEPREEWKGSLTGTAGDDLPTEPPDEPPADANSRNPEPGTVYGWTVGGRVRARSKVPTARADD